MAHHYIAMMWIPNINMENLEFLGTKIHEYESL